MNKSQYKLIVFDWDGTLMDSAKKIVCCFQSAASDLDLPIPDATLIESQIGLMLELAWANIFSTCGVLEDDILLRRAIERYRDYFLQIDQTPMPLYAGVEEGIAELDRQGYLLTVATGKARRGLERALVETDLQKHFVYTRCADEALSKPHPQMLLDTLDFCGLEAADALMVGDTHYDMQMAQNAGVDCLAVSYGVQTQEQLVPLATRGCVASFAEVVNRIQYIGG